MMKYILIPFLCLAGFSHVFGQSVVKEYYFHDLKGMEDSSGVTHLFYRMYSTGSSCGRWQTHSNDIYHFDTAEASDSVLIRDGSSVMQYFEECYYSSTKIIDYTFTDSFKHYFHGAEYVTLDSDYSIQLPFLDFSIALGFESPFRIFYDHHLKNFIFSIEGYQNGYLLIMNEKDSMFTNSETLFFHDLSEKEDLISPLVHSISPYQDSTFFGFSDDTLFKSIDYGNTWNLAFQGNDWRTIKRFQFDADSSHIYALDGSMLIVSDKHGEMDSWSRKPLVSETNSKRFLTIDKNTSGLLYYSDSTSVFKSNDYGTDFSTFLSTEKEITGLYKEPDSDILYVLTTDELLEVNVQTLGSTSLKQLPVSNESAPDVPNQITLEQNYPNPFNPSTMISYQLTGNSFVRLEVFDVTGRKVAVLVDGIRKTAGTHRVDFDASGLASGVYFYRLTTSGQTLTRKMLLIK